MRSAAFSPIMMAGTLVCPRMMSYERWPGELDRSRSPDLSPKPVRPAPQELGELGPLRRVERGVDP